MMWKKLKKVAKKGKKGYKLDEGKKMIKQRERSSMFKLPQSFLFSGLIRKRFFAFFIIVAMFVNGFVPNASQISKYSFAVIAGAVTQSMVATLFRQCNDSLVVMSQKIGSNLSKLLGDRAGNKLSESGKGGTSHTPDQAGSTGDNEYRFVADRRVGSDIKSLKESVLLLSPVVMWIVMKEAGLDVRDVGRGLSVLLLFMIFIVSIRQRKLISENNLKKNIYIIEEISVRS